MTPEQFVYWLQGFVEIREKQEVGLTEREWDIIKDHLQTVFHKVTPNYSHPSDITRVPATTPDGGGGTGTRPWTQPWDVIC